jgi:hypothetical protein
MGILDDAIKEHLELKRKHGAPEEVVQRQQEEALGPVRREAAPQPESAEAEAEVTDDDAVVAEPAAEAPAEGTQPAPADADGEQLFDGEAVIAEEPPPVEEVAAAEPAAPVLEEPPLAEPAEPPVVEPAEEPVLQEDPEAPAPATGDTPPRGLEPVEDSPRSADPGATVEYDPFAPDQHEDDEDEPAASEEEEEGKGDVLEDTPDFLQETPEHDRLWFEQKPPRDFDFE